MVENQTPAQTVLQLAIQPLHAGEYQVALDYGFTWDEIRALEALSLQDFQWLKTQSCQSPSKSYQASTSNFFQLNERLRGSDWPFCVA